MKKTIALLAMAMAGCGVHVRPKAQLTIPRTCIHDVHLTDDTHCVYNDKDKQWHCYPLVIDKDKGCEQVQVTK